MSNAATTTPHRVALLSTDFRPMLGGVADYLHRLADAMAAREAVTVMTSAPPNGSDWTHAYQLDRLPPVPERGVDRPGDRFAPLRKLRTGTYFLRLREYGERTIARARAQLGADGAVVVGIWDMAGHAWCSACRRAGMPYHLFAHGAEIVAPLYGRLPAWRAADFQGADHVIANSAATAQLAMDRLHLPARPAVVNPSVGPRPSESAIARHASELREQLALRNKTTILSLGRLVPRKGFDLVVRSIAELSSSLPDIAYLIAGDGPERAGLESLARDLGLTGRVHFLGSVDELTKWAAFDACDIFVMPNRLLNGLAWEGFGIVFLEAALSGRPSIAGCTGGASDAVVHERTGLLVDPESPNELTAALRRLLQDRALRDRLGRAGLEMARTRFTSGAAVERLLAQLGWS